MKDIMIKIKGHQAADDTGEDSMEFITEARLCTLFTKKASFPGYRDAKRA